MQLGMLHLLEDSQRVYYTTWFAFESEMYQNEIVHDIWKKTMTNKVITRNPEFEAHHSIKFVPKITEISVIRPYF